jgi:hypothetical protein
VASVVIGRNDFTTENDYSLMKIDHGFVSQNQRAVANHYDYGLRSSVGLMLDEQGLAIADHFTIVIFAIWCYRPS